jgi:hypothetical protein
MKVLSQNVIEAFNLKRMMTQCETVEYPEEFQRVIPVNTAYGPRLQSSVSAWLKLFGLEFDPFVNLDAGEDPDLPTYLVDPVDDNSFEKLWGDWPTFIFAPAGGGKTAFRVRLARACRSREEGRRIFPVTYHRMPAPDQVTDVTHGQDVHLKYILQQSAQELLFQLAYRPVELSQLDQSTLSAVCRALDANLPAPLNSYLERIRYFDNLSPLTHEFDPAASYLSNPPGPEDLRLFCATL